MNPPPPAPSELPPGLLGAWLDVLPFPAFISDDEDQPVFGNEQTRLLFQRLTYDCKRFNLADFLSRYMVDSGQPNLHQLNRNDAYLLEKIRIDEVNEEFLARATRIEEDGRYYYCCVLTPTDVMDESKHAGLLETVGSMVIQLRRDASVKYGNACVTKDLGYSSPASLPPVNHLRDFCLDFTGKYWQLCTIKMDAGETVRRTSIFKHADGSEVPVTVTIRKNKYSEHGNYTMTAQNISELRQREHELKQALLRVEDLSRRLRGENRQLKQRLEIARHGPTIVSIDPAYQAVLKKVERVAATNLPILVTGETGTGKEIVAHRIHEVSPRAEGPLVIVDCSALPGDLIESELFGHRKGAFTGAHTDRKGKFALADRGTIFLDEIGEMPLALQTRLLRVLQEGEFTPLGGQQVVRTDARVVAATNRDLKQEVRAGNFRADLFFRLNVFPIHNPPLRERRADITPLVHHFIRKHGPAIGSLIQIIAPATIAKLQAYPFPGNIRELENIVQRALIYAGDASVLQPEHLLLSTKLSQSILQQDATRATVAGVAPPDESDLPTMKELQRRHIHAVLKRANGKVSGPGGAAEILDMKPQTLHSRMRKLGIR